MRKLLLFLLAFAGTAQAGRSFTWRNGNYSYDLTQLGVDTPVLVLREGGSATGADKARLVAPALAADTTVTLPAVTSTLATLAGNETLTNKTMSGLDNTFTNLPATGLTGIVPLANGGTNKNLTAAAGALPYLDADSFELLAPTANASQWLCSGANAAPTWCDTTTRAKVIDGSADAVQLTIQGHSTQTTNPEIVVVETSAGTDLMSVYNSGITTFKNAAAAQAAVSAGLSAYSVPNSSNHDAFLDAFEAGSGTATMSLRTSNNGIIRTGISIGSTGTIRFQQLTTNGPLYLSGGNGSVNVETALDPSRGGTGVANNSAATLTRSGNHALTVTTTGTTGVTLPTTGTLATLGNVETFSAAKTFSAGVTYGGGGDPQTSLNYYREYSGTATFTWNGTAPGAGVSVTMLLVRNGKGVTMTFTSTILSTTGTGSSALSTPTGYVPSWAVPGQATRFTVMGRNGNAPMSNSIVTVINTDGSVSLTTADGTNFTNSLQAGTPSANSMSWVVP